jgi:hypothetical protein
MATETKSRRTLRFNTIDDALADVQTLADANNKASLLCLGNWTFGQNLGHVATWVDYCYDGIPMKIPFFVRWIARPLKNGFLNKPMRPGAKIPRVKGGTLAMDVVPTQAGVDHFNKSFTRLAEEAPTKPHPIFGRMTHDEWIAMNLRHAELHLSFLHAD